VHPLALTRIGQAAFLRWIKKNYEINEPWLSDIDLSDYYTPAEQVRLLYVHSPNLREQFPDAYKSNEGTRRWLEHLRRDLGYKFFFSDETWRQLVEEASASQASLAVNVLGHFCYPCGLQQATHALVGGLHHAGVQTSCRDVPGSVKYDLPGREQLLGLEVHDLSLIQVAPEPYFATCHQHAGLWSRPNVYRIASWYWELEEIPAHWARLASQVREIWAPTRFIAEALRKTMPLSIYHLLPGVQVTLDPKWTRSLFRLPADRFLFLFVFDMCSVMERKNPLGLIRAFRKAFRVDDRVQLAIKVSRGDYEPENLKRLTAATADANVILIDRDMTREESFGLIDCCDAYVSLHRSEGFGLTMAEAMLMGKPAIGTNYSGNLDFMTPENSRLVDFVKVPITQDLPIYRKGCLWADPSEEHAAHWMRWMHEHRDEARALGDRARKELSELLSLKAAGQRMAQRLQEIQKTINSKQRPIII
jgi:glycosyltransferase involved in cell wall biosynthesis